VADHWNNRVQKLAPDGQPIASWGSFGNGPGQFNNPRAVALDSRGDVYVAEVVLSAGGNRGLVPPDCHALQKFVRRGAPVEA
jgi:hypothetical protein